MPRERVLKAAVPDQDRADGAGLLWTVFTSKMYDTEVDRWTELLRPLKVERLQPEPR